MKAGLILAIIGILAILFGIINHFGGMLKIGGSHGDLIIAIIGVVLFLIGAAIILAGRRVPAQGSVTQGNRRMGG
jgi:hypothetical protein